MSTKRKGLLFPELVTLDKTFLLNSSEKKRLARSRFKLLDIEGTPEHIC